MAEWRMHQKRLGLAIAVTAALAVSGPAAFAEQSLPPSDIGENVPGAERLEGRLLAPCCWAQTLDIHGSEIANELRREIRSRLKGGESPEAIEANLVARYGERIRAVPDQVPLALMGSLGWLGVAASAVGLGWLLWRWRKRGTASVGNLTPAAEAGRGDVTDARLDEELRRIEDT